MGTGLVAAAALAGGVPAAADPAAADAPVAEIVVTAPLARGRADLVSSTSVLQEADLQRELRPQLGELLARQPGVSATSFGPNASRPVLRGLQGERIRVLTDGIGAFDVSNTSADHAVAIDPLLAERIEVLRGPASLRFGSSAVGGVVNVIDRRIPMRVPDAPVALDAVGALGSAADERALGGALTARLAEDWAVRLGGNSTVTNDLDVGGFVLAPRLRTVALANVDPDVRALAALRERLPNSGARIQTADLGVAHVGPALDVGASVSRYAARYGVPIRFALFPGEESEAVTLNARQTRGDFRAGYAFAGGLFERATLRAGLADYAHVEAGPDGAAGTRFANRSHEARLELAQRQRGGWSGVVGVQQFHRRFEAVGEEAFVPPNTTRQWGVFTVQSLEAGLLRFEAGGRLERTAVVSDVAGFDRGFTVASGAAGALWRFAPGWRVGVNLSAAGRAPAAEELLADGPHVGTQAFEIGDPSFTTERSRGAELILRGGGGDWRFEAAGYVTRFSNYIYEVATGEVRDGLPVFQFFQDGARYAGFEAEAEATLWRAGDASLTVDLLADAVRASIDNFGPAPRIPPLRLLGGATLAAGAFTARLEGEHSTAQRRVAPFETPTAAFTLLNASLAWVPASLGGRKVSLLLASNNLLNASARRHASFLKDYAPLAGRDIRLSVRLTL